MAGTLGRAFVGGAAVGVTEVAGRHGALGAGVAVGEDAEGGIEGVGEEVGFVFEDVEGGAKGEFVAVWDGQCLGGRADEVADAVAVVFEVCVGGDGGGVFGWSFEGCGWGERREHERAGGLGLGAQGR